MTSCNDFPDTHEYRDSMKRISNSIHFGILAAASTALLAVAPLADAAKRSITVGGDNGSGNQATALLDSAISDAFRYERPGVGAASATAYMNAHLFCAETPRSANQVSFQPRYQLPALVGDDVWKFPDVYVSILTYAGNGFSGAGEPALEVAVAHGAASTKMRCLTASSGSSLDMASVSHGLFDSTFGSGATAAPPATAHQNIKVSGQSFSGFGALAVHVVKLETEFDGTTPTAVSWTLVDGYNTKALSAIADASWCVLPAAWVEGTTPPAQLCDDPGLGVAKQTGQFVRTELAFAVNDTPKFVLVYRPVVGTPTVGTAIQGFAALRTGGGLLSASDEAQDWYHDDSIWYAY